MMARLPTAILTMVTRIMAGGHSACQGTFVNQPLGKAAAAPCEQMVTDNLATLVAYLNCQLPSVHVSTTNK